MHEVSVVTFEIGRWFGLVREAITAQVTQHVVQFVDLCRPPGIAEPLVALDVLRRAVDIQQSVEKPAVLFRFRILQCQLDRFANQVSPALLRLREVSLHRRVVTDQHACEHVFGKKGFERGGVLVTAENQHACLLRKQRPHGIDAP